jgi:hypothetical protein
MKKQKKEPTNPNRLELTGGFFSYHGDGYIHSRTGENGGILIKLSPEELQKLSNFFAMLYAQSKPSDTYCI